MFEADRIVREELEESLRKYGNPLTRCAERVSVQPPHTCYCCLCGGEAPVHTISGIVHGEDCLVTLYKSMV